ncbi:MAG: chloride channel protein, partial [Acidimicrobiales bacterium]
MPHAGRNPPMAPHVARGISLGVPPRRMAFLAALGALLGGVGGGSAFLIVRLVGLLSNLSLLHRVAFNLPNLNHYHPNVELLGVGLGGALVVSLLALWAPVIKGHGIPETLETILLRESRIRPRVLLAKPLSAATAMGTGGPFGAEGPIIVTGGCVGSLLGQLLPVSPAERRILLSTGAAAGMAGVFNTPVAAILIAFELLLFERSLRALLPLIFATGIAGAIHTVLLGSHPLFAAPGIATVPVAQLPLFAVLGVAAGGMAVVMNKGLSGFEHLFGRSRLPEFCHPLVGALGSSLIGLAVPGSLSVGYWAITDAVNNRFLLGAAAILCIAKLVSWWIALASNTSGGTLAPIFLVGATMGEMLGMGMAHVFPSLGIQPAAFALVAMGATFGAASRALLTSAVFALEVTGAYHLLIPMLIAMGVAELVAECFLTDRIMTDRLVRRGFAVEFDAETDPFQMSVAGQEMDPLPAAPLDPKMPRMDRATHLRGAVGPLLDPSTEYVVVCEAGQPVGIVTRAIVDRALSRRLGESLVQPRQ